MTTRILIPTALLALVAGALILDSGVAGEPARPAAQPTATGHDTVYTAWLAAHTDFVKPPDELLKKTLTRLQYNVTQKDDTERPFMNEYWDNKRGGLYVDIVSGEPLFSSTDKYDSGTGWPSFTRPVVPDAVSYHEDRSLFFSRTELRSRLADSHLGHVFTDGPAPAGLRYCINSAALRFVPKEDLAREGYGDFLGLFEASPVTLNSE